MTAQTLTLRDAYGLLGLHGPVEPRRLAELFRAAVKAARPDQPGGDADRFRRVIEAYRLIQKRGGLGPALDAPKVRPVPLPVVVLSPLEAIHGACATVALPGRGALRIMVPAGLRTGEHVRLKRAATDGGDLYLPVLIRAAEGLKVLGDDLFMTSPVDPRLLADGGRVEIDTHAGPRHAWIVGGMEGTARLCLKGLGLPARGSRPAGRLFVTLEAVAGAPSAAEHLLARFSSVWTSERLAA
ncbi:MAG: DnaJ C-terminal domain-containing protein [Brevundimonas sp.]|uniref:DnaJ C-terminal domain-containing protein n=1 Tax=Brevundimonas sp. TaxID=1871086 RepID=UPI003918C422